MAQDCYKTIEVKENLSLTRDKVYHINQWNFCKIWMSSSRPLPA